MYKLIKMKIQIKQDVVIEWNAFFRNEYEMISYFLSTMHKNGQIMSDYSMLKEDCYYIVYCTVPDIETLEEKYYNEYSKKVYKYLNIDYEILGDNIVYYDDCQCENPSWYLLYCDYTSTRDSSPLFCGDCGESIPLYKTPYLFNEQEHFNLLEYQDMYASVDNIWMKSLSDRFSKNQIVNTNSKLNKRGMEIRAELERLLNKPVYLFVRNPIGGWWKYKESNKKLDNCPVCGRELSEPLNKEITGKMCHKFRIAFNEQSEESEDGKDEKNEN